MPRRSQASFVVIISTACLAASSSEGPKGERGFSNGTRFTIRFGGSNAPFGKKNDISFLTHTPNVLDCGQAACEVGELAD